MRPGDGLPNGSLHFVNHSWPDPAYVPSKGDTAPPVLEHDIHLFMAPDGDGTWLCAAEDEALARAKLLQAVTHAAPATLDARAELAPLRSSLGAGAGFVTLAGLMSLFLSDDSRPAMASAQDSLSHARALPNVGSSAVPFLWTSTKEPRASGGPLHHVRVSMGLDPDALQDVIQLSAALLKAVPREPTPHEPRAFACRRDAVFLRRARPPPRRRARLWLRRCPWRRSRQRRRKTSRRLTPSPRTSSLTSARARSDRRAAATISPSCTWRAMG